MGKCAVMKIGANGLEYNCVRIGSDRPTYSQLLEKFGRTEAKIGDVMITIYKTSGSRVMAAASKVDLWKWWVTIGGNGSYVEDGAISSCTYEYPLPAGSGYLLYLPGFADID